MGTKATRKAPTDRVVDGCREPVGRGIEPRYAQTVRWLG